MSRREAASRGDVHAARDTTRPAESPAPGDGECARQMQRKLAVLAELLPLLRVLRQRVDEASGGASDITS